MRIPDTKPIKVFTISFKTGYFIAESLWMECETNIHFRAFRTTYQTPA